MVDVQFDTLKSEKIPFGKNNFIEVARKKAVANNTENEFISISRGYFLPNNEARFKKSITIPDDDAIKNFIAEKLLQV